MKHLYLFLLLLLTIGTTNGQDDLLSLLGNDEPTIYSYASFKTHRVINLHSLENTAAGVLDFKISHRFGTIDGGVGELFGLDYSTMHLGFDYGISDLLSVGIGRGSYQKTYDSFLKYKFLRQSTGAKNMPITAALLLTAAVQTQTWPISTVSHPFSDRMYYTGQLILGRKFSERLSLQLSPTVVQRNYVTTEGEKNIVFALGTAGRFKLSNRVAINAEYIYLLPNQVSSDIKNSLSIGFDIETGGHVFQLHFTNSTSMIEKGFVAETTNSWADGGIHFGFNISRVFTVVNKNKG